MSNYWNKSEIPHKGWILEDVIDIREDGQSVEETDYETCMMCNNEKIRYVHVVSHKDFGKRLKVGCVCAEKMTNDYVNPKKHEKKLRNKANRRNNFLEKDWKINKKGNLYLIINGHHVLIYKENKTEKFKCKIGEKFGNKKFDTIELAKVAVFNGIEYYKKKNEL